MINSIRLANIIRIKILSCQQSYNLFTSVARDLEATIDDGLMYQMSGENVNNGLVIINANRINDYSHD